MGSDYLFYSTAAKSPYSETGNSPSQAPTYIYASHGSCQPGNNLVIAIFIHISSARPTQRILPMASFSNSQAYITADNSTVRSIVYLNPH